jgi:hypothetical protein
MSASRLPSWFASATTTAVGLDPVEAVIGNPNVPSPLPNNTEAVLSAVLVTIKSRMPSLLKSASATPVGECPTA